MKRTITCFALALALAGCATFPTSYDRIDTGKVRLLDFIYEPAEAAPGDTVRVTAIFAGDSITSDRISWEYSDRISINKYGIGVGLDSFPLPVTVMDTAYSDSTCAFTFSFVVPKEILRQSPMIPDNWTEAISEDARARIPEEFKSLTKDRILTILEEMASAVSAGADLTSMADPALIAALPAVLQMFSAQRCIIARIAGSHTIRSLYTVRYHSRFSSLPGIHVNTNPVIDSVGLYKVNKEKLSRFDPAVDSYEAEFVRLSTDAPTVIIDKGYSYFVAAFSSRRDSALGLEAAMEGGTPRLEDHHPQWYFQLGGVQLDEVSGYDCMNIVNMRNRIEPLYPARDKRVESATIWLEVNDYFLGELQRPQGSTLAEVRVRFTYTDAYLESLSK